MARIREFPRRSHARIPVTARRDTLSRIAASLEGEVAGSRDAAKVRLLAGTVRQLAAAR